ncbi:MAG: hypothetical protein K5739_07865 [Lachnospiraceae bacterium]|nr:hypothetical protein [Lachnospiraceae bacterium]
MTGQFCVNYPRLNSASGELERYSGQLKRLGNRLEDISAALAFGGGSYDDVRASIKFQASQIDCQQKNLKQSGEKLGQIVKLYQKAENSIVKSAVLSGNVSDLTQAVTETIKEELSVLEKLGDEWDKWLKELEETAEDIVQFTQNLVKPLVSTFDEFSEGTFFGPSQEEHYARNENMPIEDLPQSPAEAEALGWDGTVASNCHQFTAGDQPNEKWVSPDGKYEVIFDSSGRIVTAPEDTGTYNYASPIDDPVGHVFQDIIPWIRWGNSEDDSTTPGQRLEYMIFGGEFDWSTLAV